MNLEACEHWQHAKRLAPVNLKFKKNSKTVCLHKIFCRHFAILLIFLRTHLIAVDLNEVKSS